MLLQSVDIHSQSLMLTYLQLLLLGLRQQIAHTLVVYFKHTDLHLERAGSILITFDLLEDRIANYWYESFIGAITDHGI
jgi:hypothetical protein